MITNRNEFIDSLDTTMDGLIDTAVVVYGQQTYFVPVGNLGTALPFTRANNLGQYVVTESQNRISVVALRQEQVQDLPLLD